MPVRLRADCRLVDAEFDRQFGRSAPVLSDEAREHLAACARCRGVFDLISTEQSAPFDMSPDLHDRIYSTLAQSLTPVTPIPSTRDSALKLLLVFALFSTLLVAMMGTGGLKSMTVPQILGISAILAIGAALFSASLAWQMAPGRYHRVPSKLLPAAFGIGFLAAAALLFPWRHPDAFVQRGWQCSTGGVTVAVPAAVLFWLLVRRGAPLSAGTLGGTLGAMAGLLAITVLQFKCTHQEALHLVVWHGGVLIASIGVGALIAFVAGHLIRRAP